MRCFTGFFFFKKNPRVFLIFPRVFARKTQENYPTQEKRKNIFLYYTMRWVKTQACCVFLAFFLAFLLAFLLTNLTKTQPQRIV